MPSRRRTPQIPHATNYNNYSSRRVIQSGDGRAALTVTITQRGCVGQVTMSYRLVKNSQEYWRVGTGMFIFDLESPLDIYTLVR